MVALLAELSRPVHLPLQARETAVLPLPIQHLCALGEDSLCPTSEQLSWSHISASWIVSFWCQYVTIIQSTDINNR